MDTHKPTASVHISCAIDDVALAALGAAAHEPAAEPAACHACGDPIDGEPAGRGLFLWTRGEEVRFEEPALCERCATAIGVTALRDWEIEEEEG
ncbi:MAG: hypothetical protein HY908_31165 [Myxococcales bacterium]|nr:hypothetical protein [Myxococcales bacterium]